MSLDIVDDLQAAEDTIGELLATLERLADNNTDPDALAEARRVSRSAESYCRPTCGWAFAAEEDRDDLPCEMYDDGTPACGCPCNHEDKETDR
jgi:hypothetical protein